MPVLYAPLNVKESEPLDVNVISSQTTSSNSKNIFNEVSSVASGSYTDILTYTVPVDKTAVLLKAEMGGENIATYEMFIDGDKIAKKRTYFSSGLTVTEVFSLTVAPGATIKVSVNNFRPNPSDFEARIEITETSI